MSTLVAENVSRSFGEAPAVRGVSFSITEGEVVGLLGPNGAGKSTTMRILAGAILPSAGRATLDNENCSTVKSRARIGWLPETPPLTGELTIDEQLDFAASLRGLGAEEVARVVSLCDLDSLRRHVISTLSKGTKQRVGLAQALIGDPPVLLLDEPTAGLDPAQAAHVRALIRSLSAERVVLLSTHLLHDVATFCGRALLMRDGKIVMDLKLDELRVTGKLEEKVLGALAGDAAPA